jgi:hypothetical protein
MKIIVRFFTRMKLFFTTIVRTRKEIMSDNVSHINKLTKELEQLLNEKQSQYGSFDNTSYAMKGILESILTAFNGYKVKVPLNIFGIFMINLKLWRTITNKNYKKDSYNFIKKYVKKNKYYPTYQEMADALNYKSKNSITVLVNRLAKRNELKKIKGYRRNIEINV